MQDRALLIFSGGQDSGTCLAWALQNFKHVITLGFDYGQRHVIEMQCRQSVRQYVAAIKPSWHKHLGADFIVQTDFFKQIEATALTADIPIDNVDDSKDALPNTFVPGRNILFLSMAAAWAYARNIRHIVMGVCETDSSGYPDCKDDSIKALQVALNLGMDKDYVLHTPLMWLNKAQTWDLAQELGGIELVDALLEHSHTCYSGERGQRHAWGYGCAQCPACVLRAQGYTLYKTKS